MDALERDYLDERRRKWRRSAFWRGVLVAVVALALVGGIVGALTDPLRQPHIARIEINNVIYHDRQRNAFVAELARDDNVRGVIVHISSPGGTAVGSETLYNTLRNVAEAKPLVAVMGEVAASGGYIASLASDHIIARGNTATGSIGVILEYPNVTGLMDRVGITMETLRSSDLKAGPSPFRDLTDQARAVEQEMVADSYAWFRDLVADRRDLDADAIARVADGRVFTGRQALDVGLIDDLGDEDTARTHLTSLDPDLTDLQILSWEQPVDEGPWAWILSSLSLSNRGLAGVNGGPGPRLMTILK